MSDCVSGKGEAAKGIGLRHARLDSIDNNSARSQLRQWRAIVSSWPQEATVVLWGPSGVIGAVPQTLRLFGSEVGRCVRPHVGRQTRQGRGLGERIGHTPKPAIGHPAQRDCSGHDESVGKPGKVVA